MEMSRKQAEFWVAMIVLCIIVAVAILLVDFGIKSSILEESNRLRLQIEEWSRGQKPTGANESGAANVAPNDPPYPSDVLVVESPGMETGEHNNGDTPPSGNANKTRKRRAESGGQDNIGTV
jgi:hypothetical protein